ncbi:hypothetical protein SAMN02745823_01416 [Sporobacter termitidis DSM 10068]|uniref:Polyhydroxyalkanoate synthesis regulator phasin n=1 Tax=Sporobacter termitidis DSM 10068 TaxID=1123282 RepID=A0A1M5WVK8_9FIRM|nr:hypothetical protein [Sporobacter termitidis]SHH91646.1 hypothetical protein SAMN02745823_01416 [Sporobacter termitidis DSM 10068]
MSENNLNEGLKKVLYTGVGLAAMSVDAVGKAVEALAVKGEEAVQRGKVVNEELRRKRAAARANVRDIADALEKLTKEEVEEIRTKLSDVEKTLEETGKDVIMNAESIASRLEELSKEEIDAIKAKLDEISKKWTDDGDQGSEM